jgi:hypothetical protein
MHLYPFPKEAPSLDFTRRRGPPTPLLLGAAYQRKVLRSHRKFNEPQPMRSRTFPLLDSVYDQVVRLAPENTDRKHSQLEQDWASMYSDSSELRRGLDIDAFYMLDGTQAESANDSQQTISTGDGDTESQSDRSSKTSSGRISSSNSSISSLSTSSIILSNTTRHPPYTIKKMHSLISSSTSPILHPALCRLDQSSSVRLSTNRLTL